MSKNLIYVLIDPRNGEFRYIGLTSQGMIRPKVHTKDVQHEDTYKARWIKKLQKLGLKYEIGILQELVHPDQLPAAEIKWISCYKGMGCQLTNATDGGEGTLGYKYTEERRASISGENNPNYGNHHSPETCKKISEAKLSAMRSGSKCYRYGKCLKAETRAKISTTLKGNTPWNKGISPSEETCKKLSEAAMGKTPWNKGKKTSPETRRKMLEARQAYLRRKKQLEANVNANT